MKFTVTTEEITRYGALEACARAYISRRLEKPVVTSMKRLVLEIGISRPIVSRALRDMLTEGSIRYRNVTVDGHTRREYSAKGHWGWPT